MEIEDIKNEVEEKIAEFVEENYEEVKEQVFKKIGEQAKEYIKRSRESEIPPQMTIEGYFDNGLRPHPEYEVMAHLENQTLLLKGIFFGIVLLCLLMIASNGGPKGSKNIFI